MYAGDSRLAAPQPAADPPEISQRLLSQHTLPIC